MKLPRRNFLHLAAGTAALPTASRFAWAQAYPSRPVHLIAPFAPGGAFAWRSTLFSCPIAPNWVRSSSGCGTDDCGRTSATSRPSTTPSPPSTAPSDARGRRSSAFAREQHAPIDARGRRCPDRPATSYGPWHEMSYGPSNAAIFLPERQMTEEKIIMKAIVVTDQAAGTAGMKLAER